MFRMIYMSKCLRCGDFDPAKRVLEYLIL
jgi:hypothetical protein